MKTLAFSILALIASPAAAEGTPSSTPDPNEMICRSVPQLGSRLARERRCATRAQWAEDQRNSRIATENGQNQQVNPQLMTPGERAAAAGRYLAAPGRGGAGPH